MISSTIFYHGGTIACTSEGKIIHIKNKFEQASQESPKKKTGEKPAKKLLSYK